MRVKITSGEFGLEIESEDKRDLQYALDVLQAHRNTIYDIAETLADKLTTYKGIGYETK